MSLLNNKYAVGGIMVVAVGLLSYNLLKGTSRRSSTGGSISSGSTPFPTTASGEKFTPANLAKGDLAPTEAADREFARDRFTFWIDSPPRDPFLLYVPDRKKKTSDGPPNQSDDKPRPPLQVTLKGIWRQSDAKVALLNSGVYGEGDKIEDYTVERIDEDRVWLRASYGLEQVYFGMPTQQPTGPGAPKTGPAQPKGSVVDKLLGSDEEWAKPGR